MKQMYPNKNGKKSRFTGVNIKIQMNKVSHEDDTPKLRIKSNL